MRQEVLNYQCDIIHRQPSNLQSQFQVSDPFHHRYGSWRLQETIERFSSKVEHYVRWIGCDPYAHALSLFYCMLVGCLQSDNINQDLFIKFKYSLYQECKQGLSIIEQKIFIQHLGLIQDSKNIGEFLKKSSHLQPIFIKLFTQRCSSMARQSLKNNLNIVHSKMEELQWYSAIFPFTSFLILNENCSNLTINKQQFLIVQQKQCFFVIQYTENKPRSCRISQIPGRARLSTEVYGYGIHNLDSIKSIQMLQSKNWTTQDFENNKLMPSKSQTKITQKILIHTQQQKNIKTQKQIPLPSVPLVKMTASQQNFQAKDLHLDEQTRRYQQYLSSVKTTQQKFSLKFFKQPKFILNDHLRASIRQAKPNPTYGKTELYSERVSVQKNQKSRSKNKFQKMKKNEPQGYYKQSTLDRQFVTNKTFRDRLVCQSLSPADKQFAEPPAPHPPISVQVVTKETTNKTTTKRTPKFLVKKADQIIPVTFSNSPKPQYSPSRSEIKIAKSKQKQKQAKAGMLSHKNLGNLLHHVTTPEKKNNGVGNNTYHYKNGQGFHLSRRQKGVNQ